MHMHSHGSFASLPLIWNWEYTRNVSFLTDSTIASVDPTATPYALFKGLATWWVCHLVKVPLNATAYYYTDLDDCAYEDSNYYTRPFWHPQAENLCNATGMAGPLDPEDTSPVLRNPAISLGFLKKVLRATVDASTALGVDADLRPAWQDIIDHLVPFPTVTLPDPFHKGQNMTVFTAQEHPLYFMGPSLPGQLNPLAFYALWPSEEVGVGSPLRGIGEATVRTLTGLGSWTNGNAFPEAFPAAVRAGLNPEWILQNMTNVIQGAAAPNFMLGEGQECSGALQAVNDMLLSSYDGVFRFFSVWPLSEDASFVQLRAKGAFVVSASLSEGLVGPVTVISEVGSTAILESPWPSGIKVVDVPSGQSIPVNRVADGVFSFDTKIGLTYLVTDAGAK